MLFSHPAVAAVTWWDFTDQDAWQQAPAGLVRDDMSPKPAYEQLRSLIKGKWWTKAGKDDRLGRTASSSRASSGSMRWRPTWVAGAWRRFSLDKSHRTPMEIRVELSPGKEPGNELRGNHGRGDRANGFGR